MREEDDQQEFPSVNIDQRLDGMIQHMLQLHLRDQILDDTDT